MVYHICYRVRYIGILWKEGLVGKSVSAIYGVLNLYVFLRSEIWQPTNASRWFVGSMIPHFPLSWWLLGWAIIVIVWVFEASYRVKTKLQERITAFELEAPLEIIFDLSNPNRRFWSLENNRDETGKPAEGAHWEYRAAIWKRSSKTVRNAKVTVEAIGPMPSRPEPSKFDISKGHRADMTPGEECLVVIRTWYHPPIVAGMACGTDIYGPIKMTVYADDVSPVMKLFHFDPEKTPMVWPF